MSNCATHNGIVGADGARVTGSADVDPKPPVVTVRFADTRDPSFKIDRGQSLLVAEITLAGVVECRIRVGIFTRSHDM